MDQVIDDRLVPAALHCPFQMGVLFPKCFLPYHPQYIVGQYGKFQHQLIGLELARWKPLKIHVRLQFAVELFPLPVGVVMPDDFPVSEARIGPPHIGLDVRDKKKLPLFVNGAFYDLVSHADRGMLRGTVLCLVCDFSPVASDIDILAVPGMGDVKGIVFCHPEPVLFAFLTEVALNDEIAPTLQEDADVLDRIISGIKPEEQGLLRQLAAEVDGLLKELGRVLLAVLFPFAQFQVGKVPFAANIGKHGRIAVAAFVGSGHALLAGL